MKYSEAMLKGYQMIGGKGQPTHHFQTLERGAFSVGPTPDPKSVIAACVNGAALLGAGVQPWTGPHKRWIAEFYRAWGDNPEDLNNEGMPWEHIYGMARAAGL